MIWFAMDGAGIYQLRPRNLVVLQPPAPFQATCFWTVCAAQDGSIWGGTDGCGIFRWKDGGVTHFRADKGLANQHVNAVLEDRATNIWAGTMGGLFLLRNGKFEPVRGAEALELPVFSLKEDRAGNIWAGTRNGVVRIGAGVTNVFGVNESVPFGNINSIEEDQAGRIWVSMPPSQDPRLAAGQHGLLRLAEDRFELVAQGRWAGESHIRSLQADAAGDLWIGTISAGFFRMAGDKFIQYSSTEVVPHNRIQAVRLDLATNLWLFSEMGIFGCPLKQLRDYDRNTSTGLNWWRIQRAGGLPNKSITGNGQPTAVCAPDGWLWSANGNAVVGFDPQAVIRAARLFPPLIEEILVDGVPTSTDGSGGLRVASHARRVEIRYTSPNPATPDLPIFWTRLKGLDPDWTLGGAGRIATYNLQPGDYAFSVAVTGPNGLRMETRTPLQITVVPHLWERPAVRIAVVGIALAVVAFGVWGWERARSKERLRRLEMQRAMDHERQRIARDIHDDLGAGLTEIIILSNNLTEDAGDPAAVAQTLKGIATRARTLTHDMDEVVWAVNPRHDTLESLVTYLNDFAQERLSLANIRCRLNTPSELPAMQLPADVRHGLYLSAKEALNNAIKHAAASEVTISVEPNSHSVSLTIADNGKGFDPQQLIRRGNGLGNMRQRMQETGGRFELRSQPGIGTVIRFTCSSATIGLSQA